jgi:hypothetical protein
MFPGHSRDRFGPQRLTVGGRPEKVSGGGGVYPCRSDSRSTLFFVADSQLMARNGSRRNPDRTCPGSVLGPGARIVAVVPDNVSDQPSRSHTTVGATAHRPPAPLDVEPLLLTAPRDIAEEADRHLPVRTIVFPGTPLNANAAGARLA